MQCESFSPMKNEAVVNAYFDTVKKLNKKTCYVPQDIIIEQAIASGAPRFYTSYENARRFISMLERGKNIPLKSPNKLSMYKEIHRRFKEEKEIYHCQGYTILAEIIESPAPSFYMNLETFRKILYNSLKRK